MAAGSWIYEKGGTGGGGSGGGGGLPAPDVIIDPPAELIFRSNHRVEIDVIWAKGPTANAGNFLGVEVFLEDPDISSGSANPLLGDGMPLDDSTQVSGEWAPVSVNKDADSPAVVFLDSTMGTTPGQTFRDGRTVRIYLAAYGPGSLPRLVRATESNPTPNILVNVPIGPGQGNGGMEYAFLAKNVSVTVTTDYNRPDPNYYLEFFYTPPDPSVPIPPGLNHFGGCRIIFVYEDAAGNPVFPGTDTGINVPVNQSQTGYKSPIYTPGAGGGQFRCYFCSEDDARPLGVHINSLVEGVTPFAEAIVPPVPGTPDVHGFAISNQRVVWMLDGSFVAQATFSWNLPTLDEGGIRYAGVFLYLVNVTGAGAKTTFPKTLTSQQSSVDSAFILQIPDVPAQPEVWTIAAISVDSFGVLADDPKKFGQPSFHSPTVTWNIGPPAPGSPGSGKEYAPPVTVGSATATASESKSADGVGMVSFQVGPWTNPTDNQFGSAQVAMVVNHDPTKPTYWSVPANATSFTTPSMPSFGNIGANVPVDFYLVSDDPQGNKNSLVPGTTPVIHMTYTPTSGAIIPARSGWFDPTQFAWTGSGFQAQSFSANIIQVGKTLVVGGAPASFGGSDNGQIAVLNSSGVLRAWMGEQQPTQGSGAPLWGAWFGQLWVGGHSPLDAPLWIDNQGVIEVGGIAAAQGSSQYPYISVRDDHGLETGRIGAKITVPSGTPGDSVGSNPPAQLTSGAWFTQLGVGGSNISNWNVLITPDPSNPLGSQFQMRNIRLLTIDYPALSGSPAMQHYTLEFGSSVWMAGGLPGAAWNFPGIHIYEPDSPSGGFTFGSTFLSRGMVLRGTQTQGCPVLVSLVTYNGQTSGSDSPPYFWGELAMYSPNNPYRRTVYLASGSGASGSPTFSLRDYNTNSILFATNESGDTFVGGLLQGAPAAGSGAAQPVNALAYNVNGSPVIDAQGYWKGKPITAVTGQTPWTQNIEGQGFNLAHAGDIGANRYFITGVTKEVINSVGQFVGPGADTRPQGIACGSLDTLAADNSSGPINGGIITARTYVDTAGGYYVNHVQKCDSNGVWIASVQTTDHVFGKDFGIMGRYLGWPGGKPAGTFITGDLGVFYIGSPPNQVAVYVCGGLIVNITGPGYP